MSEVKIARRRSKSTTTAITAAIPLLLALAACTSSATNNNAGSSTTANSGSNDAVSSSATSAGQPVTGGTLTFASNTDADCLDPHQSPADVAGLYSRPILDSLVALTSAGKIVPWLATSWTISKDQLTYTFALRSNVKFSDGEPFNAAAVKANLDEIVAPATKSELAAGTIAAYKNSTVIDDTHVAVHLSSPDSAFLPAIATAYIGIEAPKTLKESTAQLCTKIVGTGPFISPGGYVKGKGISYTRNPNYNWGPANAAHTGPAYLSALDIKIIPEDDSRYGALTSGQVDAIASVPPVNVAALKDTSGFQIQTAQAPGGNYNYYPNLTKGVFTDPKVRQAFREGIDWSTIVDKLYFGVFQPAKNPISPSTVGYDKRVESAYTYDPTEANKLLDEAGWTGRDSQGYRTKDGQRLTVIHPFLKSYAREQRDVLEDQIQAAAKQIGIDLENTNPDFETYLKDFTAGNYDLIDFSWQRASPDALRTLFGSENISKNGSLGQNVSRFSDPTVDKDLHEALATTDLSKQAQLYGDVQQKVTDAVAVFPIYVFNYVLGESDAVHGVEFEPQAYPTFYDAWKS